MSDIPPRRLFPNEGEPLPPSVVPVVGLGDFIQADVVCSKCQYNLRGQSREGRCPECGTAVMEAFRRGRLTYCDAKWLRRVRSGVIISFWSILAGIVLSCFVTAMVMAIGFNPHAPSPPTPDQQFVFQLSGYVISIPMLVLGMMIVHRLTAPEPLLNQPGPHVRRGAARAAVAQAWILVGLFVLSTVIGWFLQIDDPFALFASDAWLVYFVISAIIYYAIYFLIFILIAIHLRSIARRDVSPGLGKLFTFVIWGSGVNVITMVSGMVLSLGIMQTVAGVAAAAATQAAAQAATQAGSHPSTQPGQHGSGVVTVHHHTTQFSSTMPVAMFAPGGRAPISTFHAVMAPISALSGCFGMIWFILFVIAAIQFYRALSRAITHNVGMADVFAVVPPDAGTGSKLPG